MRADGRESQYRQYRIEPIKSPAGGYALLANGPWGPVRAEFEDLSALMHFAEAHEIDLGETPQTVGFKLGGLVVWANETPELRAQDIRDALSETTDGAYEDGARILVEALQGWLGEIAPQSLGEIIREELNRG